jgi:hypothetical protein
MENKQRQMRLGWDETWVEKRISPLRRQKAPPPVEMTVFGLVGEEQATAKTEVGPPPSAKDDN